MDDMIEQFTFERVAKTGGIFDRDKLDWVNGHYIRSAPIEKITDLSIPYLIEAGFIDEEFVENNRKWLEILVEVVREGMSNLSEIADKVEFLFDNEFNIEDEKTLEVLRSEGIISILEAIRSELNDTDEIDEEFASSLMKTIQKSTGIKGKNLFMPTRVALTGKLRGPEFGHIIYLLGKQNILKRIDYVEESYL